MSDEDSKGKFNPFTSMPPWVWVLVAMGGGSGIGVGGMKLSLSEHEEPPQECSGERDLAIAIARAESAEASHRAMIESLQTMALLLGECQTGRDNDEASPSGMRSSW